MQNITRIYALSKRNVILRYKNSLVGFFWGFFKPLLYLLIFIVVFSKQFSTIDHYTLYATSGLVFWFFFSNIVNQSIGSIISSTGIIKSINVPVIFFPLSETISELFNLSLTFIIFFIVMYWFGIEYSFRLFLIIPVIILFSVFAFGVAMILCSLNVFFRDVGILWTTIQPALFYLTPIAYPKEVLTKFHPLILKLNPIYYFIDAERMIVHQGYCPPMRLWLECVAIAAIMFMVGYFVFSKLKQQFIAAI